MKMVDGDLNESLSTFKPIENIFKQFEKKTEILKWENSLEKVGYANLYMDDSDFMLEIVIEDFESYGHGAEIINYLMNLDKMVIIRGDSIKEAIGFWGKMGAYFHTRNEELNSFEIKKEDFKETRYYKNLK